MNTIKVGPVGGKNGTVWDEKGRGEIAKIFLSTGPDFVLSLQFLYVENGQFVLSDRYGAHHNYTFATVVLDYPSEFITWISGTYYTNGLRSITFGTNKSSYGPYGRNTVNPLAPYFSFSFQIGDDRSFDGFHGTKTDAFIESIGVYMKTITSSMITATVSQLMTRSKKKKMIN
ncbi:PREDICTED: inactive protein RESTRICTED TEV MOVEMENT 1-like [Nicotiana attenuata]|uniref:Protein restricted tev movement 1 n=1 Tax=Nicotiana attenuata TaxID=49451 RepID=A0A1J6JWM7_NICAT|nr:PREDICTED: inactive protein RESTRICTED TEV MOVEMENT 1-like [Nicotiana attenuata]OIT21534.1 protein restricted tev movement 1 [Nicotiana attenuata]